MPVKRRSYRKRRKNSRKPFSLKQIKAIKKISNMSGELKFKYDLTNVDTSVTDGASYILDLDGFAIAQGTDNDERVGDKIRIKDLTYQMIVDSGSAGYDTTDGHIYRLYVIQTFGGIGWSEANSPNALEFFREEEQTNTKYKILYNKIVVLNPDVTNSKFHSIRIDGKRLRPIVFDDAATTVSQNQVSIYVTPMTVTSAELQVRCSQRIRFYDS